MRTVCVVTGSRAEYGLLRPLILALQSDAQARVAVLVTGMHLSNEFGLTYRDIEAEGVAITERVEILLSSDTREGMLKSMGLALIGFADSLARIRPDLVVVLGDRFEALCAATAAAVHGYVVAHVHGGELTEGALDDAFRHAITKLSHLHFTSTEAYRRRVIQLGEHPDRVHNTGALAVDVIRSLRFLEKPDLERELGIRFPDRSLLVAYHAATAAPEDPERAFREILEAVGERRDTLSVFTKANADPGGRRINALIDEYVGANPGRSAAFVSLGQLRFLSLMRCVDGVVGNSSSGIIEAPYLRVGTVNIGERQKGRIKAGSVIDCRPFRSDIAQAIDMLYDPVFRRMVRVTRSPYGEGGAAERVARVLMGVDLEGLHRKPFYDVDYAEGRC